MRLLLLVAVLALAVDAINFSGAYSQAAWNTARAKVIEISGEFSDRPLFDRNVASADDTRAEPASPRTE